jgi:hypothetical protein
LLFRALGSGQCGVGDGWGMRHAACGGRASPTWLRDGTLRSNHVRVHVFGAAGDHQVSQACASTQNQTRNQDSPGAARPCLCACLCTRLRACLPGCCAVRECASRRLSSVYPRVATRVKRAQQVRKSAAEERVGVVQLGGTVFLPLGLLLLLSTDCAPASWRSLSTLYSRSRLLPCSRPPPRIAAFSCARWCRIYEEDPT